MNESTHVILASASPRRAQLLHDFGIEFEVLPARTEESQPEHFTPTEACLLNAYHKARAVAKKFPDAIVIGADTEVVLGQRVFGKPRDRKAAARMLAELEEKSHQVITGVCVLHLRSHRQKLFTEQTIVTFRSLGGDEIDDYLDKINPLDKAGAYAIQEHGDMIVDHVEGSYSNVVGLPMERLREELREFDVREGA
ncbi:MAG TPA: Maf family protein, partial [Candidatus Acidoferrum sp.]|nr:Maf family protein [Candidatus Acidoferrum sp.]